jgi:2-isopropylmalate synthase
VVEIALAEGASTINLADTVGYAMPDEYAGLVRSLLQRVAALGDAVVSVHCHNDLGLAVANTVAGARAGARQAQCSVNGLGERAGNAALEEVVMLLDTRSADLGLRTGIDTTQIAHVSRLVAQRSGIGVAANKAVVGANAFVHGGAIHRRSTASDRTTYEIMSPQTIGLEAA